MRYGSIPVVRKTGDWHTVLYDFIELLFLESFRKCTNTVFRLLLPQGLYDTVFDVDNDKARAEAQGLEPNGFNFDGADGSGVDYALNRAITAWYGARDWFNSLCKTVMEQDWSWNRPALEYIELYHATKKS
ncbi:hypothetical protein Golob_003207 [Gossypium lobatum]|uniref:starch synthase n=1 Tax=Gossypium lobatum TaxID=34289 RepID=A0A7J8MXU4_9ROSI|nr:hypothetical protein [Gossypium lobatum]